MRKPFLAALFAFSSLHARGCLHRLPAYVRLVTNFLAERISRRRVYPSVWDKETRRAPCRVDAKAEGKAIRIGDGCHVGACLATSTKWPAPVSLSK